MKSFRVSLFKYASHRFWRSLRTLDRHFEPMQLIDRLISERSRTLKELLRTATVNLGLVLWLVSNTGQNFAKITIFSLDVEIPKAFVAFGTSFSLLLLLLISLSYLQTEEYLRLSLEKYLYVDEPHSLSPIYDGLSSWSQMITQEFRFYRSSNAHKNVARLAIFSITVTLVAFYGLSLLSAFKASAFSVLYDTSSFNIALSLLSICLLFAQLIYLIAMFFPYRFTKNEDFIRWNFLVIRVYKKGIHPRSKFWLDERNKK